MLGQSWGCIRRTWGLLGYKLGSCSAMLGPSWQYQGKTWELLGSSLGVDHQKWKAHTFLKAFLEHVLEGFAYKTNGFSMVLKWDCSSNIENWYFAEMLISFSQLRSKQLLQWDSNLNQWCLCMIYGAALLQSVPHRSGTIWGCNDSRKAGTD